MFSYRFYYSRDRLKLLRVKVKDIGVNNKVKFRVDLPTKRDPVIKLGS